MPRKVFRYPNLEPSKDFEEYTTHSISNERGTDTICPRTYHRAPGYSDLRFPGMYEPVCVKDCSKWKPPARRLREGMCGTQAKKKSQWIIGLRRFWEEKREKDPGYKYKTAMKDFRSIYYARKPRGTSSEFVLFDESDRR